MDSQRDGAPFARLVGDRLYAVNFVLNDYVQLSFDNARLNAYAHPVVKVGEQVFRWGDSEYRNALCDRILSHIRSGWVTPDEIVIQLDDESELAISNRAEDAHGPESAELSVDGGGLWVWRFGEWSPTVPKR